MPKKKRTSQQKGAKNKLEKLRTACRRWRARHPEQQQAATYKWRRRNRTKWNTYMRRWRKRHPQAVRTYTRKRYRRLKRDPVKYAQHLAAGLKWALRHPEVVRRNARVYRRKNIAKVRRYHRNWMKRWYRTHLREARRKSRLRRKQSIKKWRSYDRRLYHTKLKTNPKWVVLKRARGRIWAKRNPFKQRHRVAQYRARKIGAKGSHTLDEWILIIREHKWRCFYCRKRVTRSTVTKDHLIPLSKKGTNFAINLVPACKACNSGKSGRLRYKKWKGGRP